MKKIESWNIYIERRDERIYEIQINKRRKRYRIDQYLITRIISRKIEHAKLITSIYV